MNRKGITFLVLAMALVAVAPLMAQSPLDQAATGIANDLIRSLGTPRAGTALPRVSIGQFTLNQALPPLSNVWTGSMEAGLIASGTSSLVLIAPGSTTEVQFRVQGEFFNLGQTLRIQTRLIRVVDGAIVFSKQSEVPLDGAIMGLLQVATNGGSGSSIFPDVNETDAMARPLSITPTSSGMSRTLHNDDEDFFSYVATSSGMASFFTTGSMDTTMEVYLNGTQVESDDDSGDDSNARVNLSAAPGQTYIIKVLGYEGETGSYTMNMTFETLVDNLEPNDTSSQASRLTFNTPIQTAFSKDDDLDWYVLTIPAGGGMLSAYTTSSIDTILELYDNEGELIAEDDDSGENNDARLRRVLTAGVYRILAKEYEGGLGSYTIQAEVSAPPAQDRFESDDTRAQAKSIIVGATPQSRTFSHTDDEDWAMLTIARQGRYEIHARAVERSGLDSVMTLYDAQEVEIESNDDGGEDYDAKLEVQLAPGTYYIQVRQIDSEVKGDGAYTLGVRPL